MSGELCAIGLHDIDRPLTISLQRNHACIRTQLLDDDEGLYKQLYWLWPDYQSLDCPTLSALIEHAIGWCALRSYAYACVCVEALTHC